MSLSCGLVLIHFNIVHSLCIHTQSLRRVQLFVTPRTVAHQLFKPEYGVGPFPPAGDLPDPEIEPWSPMSPTLAGEFFTTEPPGKPHTL